MWVCGYVMENSEIVEGLCSVGVVVFDVVGWFVVVVVVMWGCVDLDEELFVVVV